MSELFEKIFHSGGSGCFRDCSCGQTFYDVSDNQWDWEEGERERLEKDGAIPLPYAVGTLNVNGVHYVPDCTCGGYQKFEAWLITDGDRIAEFLNEMSDILKKKSEALKVK